MSWLRFGNLDRFSPFTRSPPQGSTTVSDADFSYITKEDLDRHAAQSETDLGPARDTDVITLKDKRNDYAIHFAAYSIAKGELRIKALREAAAKKLGVEPRKIKLLYKGRNLKDDRLQCRAEGLRTGSEVLCSVLSNDPTSLSDLDESEDDSSEVTKKKRNRSKKKKSKQDGEQNLNVPVSSRGVSPGSGASTPLTAKDKLDALREKLRSFDTEVDAFLKHPPADKAKREFDRKRISETILAQVLLKTDAIESEGDPAARTNRKELVKECQDVLKLLDEAHGGNAA